MLTQRKILDILAIKNLIFTA